jgi:Zn-dependent protease with chaperone function
LVDIAPIIIVFGVYLFVVGVVVNATFRGRLSQVIEGRGKEWLRGDILAQVYGFHLVLLIGLAYVVLAYSAAIVVAFGAYGILAITHGSRFPAGLAIAIIAVPLGSLWGIVRSLAGGTSSANFGVELSRSDEPVLWRINDEVAASVGTSPSHSIILSPMPGIGVREEGGLPQLVLGTTRRVVTIGAPSISGLTVQQFRAILAHEYGHFSNRDTAWTSLTFRAGASVNETVQTMQSVGGRGFWLGLVRVLNPARWLLWAYRLLFLYVTSGFSRMREVYADIEAVEQYGAVAFVEGLRTIVVNDWLFAREVYPHITAELKNGKYLSSIPAVVEGLRSNLTLPQVESIVASVASRPPSPFDSHPAVSARLSYAPRFEKLGVREVPSESAESLATLPLTSQLENWDVRAGQVSELLSMSLYVALGYRPTAQS